MKKQNLFRILLITLFVSMTFGFSSCRIIFDSIANTDGAYWEGDDYDKFTVTFSDKTKEDMNVSIDIVTIREYGKCSTKSSYSLSNSKTYKLSRSLKKGEYIRIYWWGSFNSETLYVKN